MFTFYFICQYLVRGGWIVRDPDFMIPKIAMSPLH